jgi:hypothetical protein
LPSDQPPAGERGSSVSQESKTTSAPTENRLNEVVERNGLSVADRIALQDAELRQWMTNRMVRTFIWANSVTLAGLAILVALDEINIAFRLISPEGRIVTYQVLMALLGATTVQIGAIAAIIARYLFPTRLSDG